MFIASEQYNNALYFADSFMHIEDDRLDLVLLKLGEREIQKKNGTPGIYISRVSIDLRNLPSTVFSISLFTIFTLLPLLHALLLFIYLFLSYVDTQRRRCRRVHTF
jgi:hypothetical protein